MQQTERAFIRCGNVLTMTDRALAGPQIIEIEGDRIRSIRPAGEAPSALNGDTIDLSRATVLPGLIDAHTHLGLDVMAGNEAVQAQLSETETVLRAASHGAKNLRRGATTVRLVGEKSFIDIPLRAMFDAGGLPGPRIVTATRGIRPSHGHGALAAVADGTDAVTRMARENIHRGADHIKLFVTGGVATPGTEPTVACMTREEIAAAVNVAHRAGKTVCAHAYGGQGVDDCLEVGVDHVEHGIYMAPRQFAHIAELDRWLIGTLGVFMTEPGPAEDPSWPAETRAKFLKGRAATADSVAQAKTAGVKMALGTDAIHGGVVEEAIFAAGLGLSNREALAAITVQAANVCGLSGTVGTIEPGAFADLIAVSADPLVDVRALRSVLFVVLFVMKGGKTVVPITA